MASPIREDLSTESSIKCSHSNSASTTGWDCFCRSSYRSSGVLFLISSSPLYRIPIRVTAWHATVSFSCSFVTVVCLVTVAGQVSIKPAVQELHRMVSCPGPPVIEEHHLQGTAVFIRKIYPHPFLGGAFLVRFANHLYPRLVTVNVPHFARGIPVSFPIHYHPHSNGRHFPGKGQQAPLIITQRSIHSYCIQKAAHKRNLQHLANGHRT